MSQTALLALQALKQPFITFGRAYNAQAQRRPLATGIVTTVVKTSAADLFAQKVMEGKEWKDVDWKRHGLFCTFGLFYLGGFQYYLYNHLFVKWCHQITARVGHKGSAPIKTFIDQAIHHPFCYFPCFYLLKGAVEERPLSSTYAKYKAELWENCKALWTIWVPAQMVNFAVVPRHLRIPYVAGVSFLWTVIISMMRGAVEKQQAPTTQQLEDAVAAVASAAAAATTPAASQAMGGPGVLEQRQQQAVASARSGSGGDDSGGIDSSGSGTSSIVGVTTGAQGLGLKALVSSPEVQT